MSILWDDDNTIDSYDYDTEDLMDNFDPADSYGHDIIGNPAESMENWHQQTHDNTCVVMVEKFIIEERTGLDFSEEQLRQESAANGWYTDGGGTPINDVGNLLEDHGIEVEKSTGNNLNDIAEQLSNGEQVIVGVNSEELWNNTGEDATNDFSGIFAGSTEHGPDHAVEVIGIDNTNPDDPMVILNDPGHPEGMGMEVPADQFTDAWDNSNNFMVNTTENVENITDLNDLGVADSNAHVDSSEPSLGGFYNADGTYHWSSDNTNTDEKGNVVYYGIK